MLPLLLPKIDVLFSAATSARDNSTKITHFGPQNGIYAAIIEAALALNIFETLCRKAYEQNKCWELEFGRFTTKQDLVI
jgi:hypothetical protein